MFRSTSSVTAHSTGFPHSRGDVPNCQWRDDLQTAFSPLAWGCSRRVPAIVQPKPVFPTRVGMFRYTRYSATESISFPRSRGDVPATDIGVKATGDVFPTRVGMFRRTRSPPRPGAGFPHSRGDVPCDAVISHRLPWFSPLAWGCSGLPKHRRGAPLVFPTRVGMFRVKPFVRTSTACFPHSRGDVPRMLPGLKVSVKFSPLAWGCSGTYAPGARRNQVFPTRVGMFRTPIVFGCSRQGFPHSRGDVPASAAFGDGLRSFSPLAWGCSDRRSP